MTASVSYTMFVDYVTVLTKVTGNWSNVSLPQNGTTLLIL